MKFNCGRSHHERHEAKKIWHKYFAWLPTRVATSDCRWLETFERKGRYYFDGFDGSWLWEYRSMK
jgi:hypothetical protein